MKTYTCKRCGKEMYIQRDLCDWCFAQDNIDKFGYL